MLKIIVQGEPLDLKSDMIFEYRIKNPFFEDDVIPVPATYTFSVPLTSRNNRLLGYPLRLNQTSKVVEFEASIVFGAMVIAEGLLVIKTVSEKGSVNLFFKAQSDEGVLDEPLCDLHLNEYDLRGGDYLENLHALCEQAFRKEVPFALPMVRITNPSDKVAIFGMERCDYAQITAILGFFGKKIHKVALPDDVYVNPYSVFSQTLSERNKYYTIKKDEEFLDRIAPFPYLWHIIEVVLSSLNIYKNPFKDGGVLESIVVSATYCPKDRQVYSDKIFRVNKSLPSCNTGDFVKEVFKGFGFSLNRLRGKTDIVSYKEMLQQKPLSDWSSLLEDGWSVEGVKPELLVAGVADKPKEYSVEEGEKRLLRTVQRSYRIMYELYLMAHDLSVDGISYERKDIEMSAWYVVETGEYYYSYFDEKTQDYWLEYKGVKLSDAPLLSSLKKKKRQANLKVPTMVVDFAGDLFEGDWSKMPVNGRYEGEFSTYVEPDGFTHRYTYLPFIEAKRNERDFTPALLSYVGHESSYIPYPLSENNVAPSPSYPFATTNGRSALGKAGFDFADMKTFSLAAKEFFEKEKAVLKGKVLLSERQIKELSGIDVVMCKGKRWLLKEISIPIKPHRIYPAVVTLVEIPELDSLSFPDYDVWC